MAVFEAPPSALAVGIKPRSLWRELRWRLPIAAGAVLVCYRFQWTGLRVLTSQCALEVARLSGLAAHRVSFDTIAVGQVTANFTVSCVFADVWCAALPLLWSRHLRLTGNAARVSAFTLGLFALNQMRLALSYVFYGWGAPWRATDLGVGGAAYFIAWLWVARRLRAEAAAAPGPFVSQSSRRPP